jgi:DNA-binding IclR family transcriptional regulator
MHDLTPLDSHAGDETRTLRPLAVLEQLALAGHAYTLSQLAARTHIPKATLLRLIDALEAQGYVTHMPDSRGTDRGIALGPRAAQLALATLANNSFTRTCRSILRTLVDLIGESCNLTALDGDTVLYIERVETAEPLRLHMQAGMRVPLHCTASGKLFLSQMPLAERRQILSRLPLTKRTHRTLTDQALLEAELDRLHARGIGIDNEEFVLGMVAVGVPITDASTGRVLACLAAHAPTARASLNDLLQTVPQLRETAVKLAALIDASDGLAPSIRQRSRESTSKI